MSIDSENLLFIGLTLRSYNCCDSKIKEWRRVFQSQHIRSLSVNGTRNLRYEISLSCRTKKVLRDNT